jgi:hypothetical protein
MLGSGRVASLVKMADSSLPRSVSPALTFEVAINNDPL